jgi:nitroreductase
VKLDRAPTLIVVSCALSGDPIEEEEDLHAAATASYIVLLAAHARGFAGYWRTPGILRSAEGRAAVGLGEEERFVGLLHLGLPRQEKPAPERPGADRTTTYLD